jgi:hypothetical protein
MSQDQIFKNVLFGGYNNESIKNVIHEILVNGVDGLILAKGENGNNLLQTMILNRDFKGVDILLNYLKSKKELTEKVLNNQNVDGNTPSHLTLLLGYKDLTKKFHMMGANLSIANKNDEIIQFTDTESEIKLPIMSATSEDIQTPVFLQSKQVPAQQQTFNFTGSDASSSTIDTADFLKFLEKNYVDAKKQYQVGGAEEVMGRRKIKRQDKSKKNSQKDTEKSNVSASDTLGIFDIIAKQHAGSVKLSSKRSTKSSKRSTKSSKRSTKSSKRSTKSSKRSSKRLSSRQNKPSTDVHAEVIEIIKKMGYSEDDARYIKAGLYQMVKDKFANLSNMQRSLKLKEVTTSEEVEKMKKLLPKLKELVEKAREKRKIEKESSVKSEDSTKKERKPKDSSEKGEKKVKTPRVKKPKEEKTETSSDI